MRRWLKMFIGFLILFLVSVPDSRLQPDQPQKSEDLVSLTKQRFGLEVGLEDLGWSRKEEDVKGSTESGEITFSDTKWLMFLIHWGPIQVPQVPIEYVKEMMLKMWGVNFKFTGKEGTTRVSGHDAAWAEAYGTNKYFYTRFIIWNCPDSGREFIAYTNYNLRRKTPKEDFEKEMLSARTVQCHPGALAVRSPELTKKFESDKFKEPEKEQQKAFFSGRGIFQTAQWNLESKKKKIVVTLLTRQYKYATEASSPTQDFQDKFLRDLIKRID